MRSLKLEQVAVIKFLTLEGSSKKEIFHRLKNVFSSFTLPKDKIFKLHFRFLKEGLLGLKEEPPYEDECTPETPSPSSPSFDEAYYEVNYDALLISKNYSKNKRKFHQILPTDKKNYKIDLCGGDKFQISEDDAPDIAQSMRLKRKASVKAKQTWRNALTRIKNESDDEMNTENLVKEDEERTKIEMHKGNLVKEEEKTENECVAVEEEKSNYEDNAKTELSSRVLSHPSIFRSENEALASIAPKQLCCTICQGRKFDVPFMLKRHFKRLHLNHKVKVGPFLCLICRCGCSESVFLRSHYHCPICSYVTQKMRVIQHYKQHLLNSSNLEELKMEVEKRRKTCICIDRTSGLYLVPKTDIEPTHVIKKNENGKKITKCSQSLCESAMLKARKNGILDLHCKHILRANDKSTEYIDNESIFTNIMNSEYLSISEEERDMCFYLIEQAFEKKVSPLVEWIPESSDSVSFFSVFCDASYGIFGRLIIKYEATANVFHCDCPLTKESDSCPYTRLCELYLKFSRNSK